MVPVVVDRSPATMRSNVVLPAPFGPTSATLAPSPTRKLTSANSCRPSASVCATPAMSTYPTGASSPQPRHDSTCFPAGPQYPEALLACHPLDVPALLGQPCGKRVGAQMLGDNQPGHSV